MNNYILINRTFAETTPESVEIGDFSNTGFVIENEQVTFRELVKLMEEHYLPSSSLINEHTWFSTEFYTTNYRTGAEREESIHFSRDNSSNVLKYWAKAWKIANNS